MVKHWTRRRFKMCRPTIMCERPDMKRNHLFCSSSRMIQLTLDSFMVEIFLEVENELFRIKRENQKLILIDDAIVPFWNQKYKDAKVAVESSFRCGKVTVYLQG